MTWHADLETFSALLPGEPSDIYPEGLPFRTAMATGTMSVEFFAPTGTDRQQPHDQDELYVVARGSARFVRPDGDVACRPGTVLFVPAGMEHRFVDMADGFATWVIFWGTDGGERGDVVRGGFAMDVTAPVRLDGDGFVLEPLAPRHNAEDHAAWSSSIEHIQATPGFGPSNDWGADPWPYPMTRSENMDDLERHAQEFGEGAAFAFSVLDRPRADGGDVIGCVYINPDERGVADAKCRSWVRATHAHLDEQLHRAVRAWLSSEAWPFDTVRFPGRD